jgi:hypothetical protein
MPDKPKAPQGKKLPKWAIPVGAVAVVGIVLFLKKKQAPTEGNATEPGTSGLSNQSFIPVTGENVAGVGASGGGTVESGSNNTELLREIIKGDKESAVEQSKEQHLFFEQLIASLGTGGGAPSTPAPAGGVAAPPPESQPAAPPAVAPPAPAPAPPPPAPKPAGCPGSFPLRGPHGCYHDITCGNGCQGHRYQNGMTECQVKTGGKCHW